MNLSPRTLLGALALAFVLALTARGQERLFVAVDYMHLPEQSSEQAYLDLEKLWQRVHQKAVEEGRCLGWYLDRIENDSRNQFVTLRVYDSPAKLFDPWPGSLSKLINELYAAEEATKMARTEQIRQLTRSEVWELEASAIRSPGEVSDYIYVDFMKVVPGKADAYYQAEKEVFRKAHQVRVDGGDMKAWFFLSRAFPSGHDADYDFITVNGFASKAASEKPWDMEKIAAALTKEDMAKGQEILSLRTGVRREIWRPVLRTTPAKK